MEVLFASKKKFDCYSSKEVNTLNFEDLSFKDDFDFPELNKVGFLVIKNVIPRVDIDNARDTYFKLFKNGEYKKCDKKWIHLNNHQDPHGCNNHPSKDFLKKKEFLKIILQDKLNFLAKKLLKSQEIMLSPRKIVRSFSKLSSRCTFLRALN